MKKDMHYIHFPSSKHMFSPVPVGEKTSPSQVRHTLYFTTKHLHEEYRVSSGQNRWLLCPLLPERIIKLCVIKNAILAQT